MITILSIVFQLQYELNYSHLDILLLKKKTPKTDKLVEMMGDNREIKASLLIISLLFCLSLFVLVCSALSNKLQDQLCILQER